jgi:hypothetical protein
VKKKKISERSLGELMSGVVAVNSAQTPTSNSTTSSQDQVSSTKSATTPKQEETKPHRRPSLPSLKQTPSFSVKDAMAGKITPSAPTPSSTNDTGTDVSDNFDEVDESFESMVEEVDFTPKNMEQVWNRFANHIKASRPRIGNALLSNKPNIIDDNLISFDVVNQQQKDEITTICNELVGFIRKSLGTPMLELEFNVAETDSINARPYTIDEKFKFMIQKNPAVLTLKQALGLDFE